MERFWPTLAKDLMVSNRFGIDGKRWAYNPCGGVVFLLVYKEPITHIEVHEMG
jgi:hypothetical protein